MGKKGPLWIILSIMHNFNKLLLFHISLEKNTMLVGD